MDFSQFFGISSDQYGQQVNQLLTQAAPAILCGPDCQAKKTTTSLQQKYIDAQNNLKTAPGELFIAQKNYLVNTQGIAGYTKTMTAQYTAEATKITTDSQKEFNHKIEIASAMIDTYDSLYNNTTYLTNFLDTLRSENAVISSDIQKEKSDTVTNDRKSYYEAQGYEVLISWYYLFAIIYCILLVVFTLGIFLSPTSYSYFAKFSILFLFIIYPFIITYIILLLLSGLVKLGNLLPKNVYVGDMPINTQPPLTKFNNAQYN